MNAPLHQGDDLPKLTPKQRTFADAFILTGNATAAALEAGYPQSSAHVNGSKLVRNSKVAAYIAMKRPVIVAAVEEKQWLTTEYVLTNLKEMTERCMQKTPVMEWSPEEKRMVATGEWAFDSKGAGKALELLGRYLKMWESKSKVEQNILNIQIVNGTDLLTMKRAQQPQIEGKAE
jgi:phage terminase small subunit